MESHDVRCLEKGNTFEFMALWCDVLFRVRWIRQRIENFIHMALNFPQKRIAWSKFMASTYAK